MTTRTPGEETATADETQALPGRPEIELLHPTRGLEVYPGVFMPDIDQARTDVRHWRPRARLFVLLFLVLFAGQWMAVVAVNYVVDPRSDFGTGLFDPVVFNDVRLKTALLDARPPPDLLILGSSRSITIEPTLGGDVDGFNFAVSHGNLPEQRLIYELVADRVGPPKEVIVGLELERLWGMDVVRRHVENSPAGRYQDPPPDAFDTVGALVDTYDWRYVRDSGAAVLYTIVGYPPGNYAFEADGVRRFRPFEDPDRRPHYDAAAAIAVSHRQLVARVERLRDAPEEGIPELEDLVASIRRDNASVHLVFTPYHPDLLAAMVDTDHARLLALARAQVSELCATGVQVHDFTAVESFGGDPAGFYDGWHFVGDTARMFAPAVLAGRASLCP